MIGMKKSPWVCYHNSGGCIPGDTEIILEDGTILTARGAIDNHLGGGRIKDVAKGAVWSRKCDFGILSKETSSPKMKKTIRAYKLKSPSKLISIKTGTASLRLTPEHKVLIDRIGGPKWLKAGDLQEGDYVYCPRRLPIKEQLPNIQNAFPDSWIIHLKPEEKDRIRKKLKARFSSLKQASKILHISYKRLTHTPEGLKICELRKISSLLGLDIEKLLQNNVLAGTKTYMLPSKYPDKDLLYVLGLIASDGYISVSKGGRHATYKIAFDNNNKALVDLFIKRIKRWVSDAKVGVYTPKKQPKLYRVNAYSHAFVQIAEFFGIGQKTDLKPIFKLPEELIAHFLAGFFDGDGHASVKKYPDRKKQRIIMSYSTNNEDLAKQLQLLLKRIGVVSRIDSTLNRSTFGTKMMHRVRITFQDDILRFAETVPVMHPEKQKKIKFARKYLEKFRDKYAKINTAPLEFNSMVREARKRNRLTQKELHKHPVFIGMIEHGRRIQKHIAGQIVNSLQKHVSEGEKEQFRDILSDDFYLDPIKKIAQIKTRDNIVYNFEVDGTHNFIPANGFVISNCNGCALETMALITPRFDVERFGCILKSSARHADILLISGALCEQNKKRVVQVYNQMSPNKKVIAVGICAISGGIFRGGYNVKQRIDEVIPVDMYVPGCPPRPEAIIDAIIKVLKTLK